MLALCFLRKACYWSWWFLLSRYNDKVLGGPIMSIQEGQTCFNYVCNAASELNAAFSFTAFVILTTEFVSAVINLYTLTASIMQPSDLMQRRQPKFIFNFMIGVLIIIVVSYTAEIPVREVRIQGFFTYCHDRTVFCNRNYLHPHQHRLRNSENAWSICKQNLNQLKWDL